jgi:hypothetical protein
VDLFEAEACIQPNRSMVFCKHIQPEFMESLSHAVLKIPLEELAADAFAPAAPIDTDAPQIVICGQDRWGQIP